MKDDIFESHYYELFVIDMKDLYHLSDAQIASQFYSRRLPGLCEMRVPVV